MLEDRSRIVPLQNRPSVIAAVIDLCVGRLSEARQRLNTLRDWSSERADESDLAWLACTLSWCETMSGNLGAAAALADEAELLARLAGTQSVHGWALSQRALVAAHQGLPEQTRRDSARALSVAEGTDYVLPRMWAPTALGLLELSLGDFSAAWRACAPLTEFVEINGIPEPIPPACGLLASIEALIGLGDFDRADRLTASFEQRARDLDRPWALATSARCRGLLLAARGDVASAADALERAMVEHGRMDMPFELARTLLVQGQLYRRLREKRLAAAALKRAHELFDSMGAQIWAHIARAEQSRVGLRAAPTSLTATEERVARLAASGLTNRAIAATLFISPKTVEANLARIYAKLRVRSRVELARQLAPSTPGSAQT
jgi:DNA-binding CsgD family transcriptional regulator